MGLGRKVRNLGRVETGRIDVHARAGLNHVGHDQTDDQGQGREGQEIGKGLGRGPAKGLQITHARNAGDNGQENDRPDDHLDELDEGIAQRLEGLAQGRVEVPDQGPGRNRDQDLKIEMAIPRGLGRPIRRRLCRCHHPPRFNLVRTIAGSATIGKPTSLRT